MSIFIFAGCVCLYIVSGARPSREWTIVLDVHSLPNTGIQQPSPEASKQNPTGCRELKGQLVKLGIRGEGNPCHWEGIGCSSHCEVSSIVRNDATGDLNVVKKFSSLHTLELRNSQVAGGINALKPIISLQKVDLSGTKVAGRLLSLKSLKNLTMLNLSNTAVKGDLTPLQSLNQLEILDLSNTQLCSRGWVDAINTLQTPKKFPKKKVPKSGFQSVARRVRKLEGSLSKRSLASLRDLTRLKVLSLSHTGVRGDLEPLRSLTELEVLDLSHTRIKNKQGVDGLEPLIFLQHLGKLDLSNSPVAGDLRFLERLRNLQELELSKTMVEGELQELQGFTKLRRLKLEGTQVRGDLASIRHLTQLQHLVLDNTRVHGSLASLQQLTQIQQLALDATAVAGDLSGLQSFTNLRGLQLHKTQVDGNVSALQNLRGLEDLNLANTLVEGNLRFVQKLTALRSLSLHHTEVGGDLGSLQNLVAIEELHLHYTMVVGDMKSIAHLTSLKVIRIYGNNITGDLRSFHGMQDLEWLSMGITAELQHLTRLNSLGLERTKVHGDIGDLQRLTALERGLWLADLTEVTGDISVLRKFPRLKKVFMDRSNVMGDLGGLKGLNMLETVGLADTQVTGQLEDLHGIFNFKTLHLKNLKVKGDLKAFKRMKRLQALDLTNTSAFGDISDLGELRRLEKLFLGMTKVHGDVNMLADLDALQVANLEGTGVSGWMALEEWRGRCQNLQELNLAESQLGPLPPTRGVPKFSTRKGQLLLPALNLLNVSGCPLNGSMEDLLWPLAGSGMSMLLAFGCGLTGKVPDIGAMMAEVDDVLWKRWSSTLQRSLQTLDVSSNSISLLEAVPARVRLDVRNNAAPITLPRGIISKAAHQRVELWLRDTHLANPKELQPLLSDELRLEDSYTWINGNFACRRLVDPMLQVTPELFMPQQMCRCRGGYAGTSTVCSPCPANTYADEESPTCLPCPKNSNGPSLSSSWENCRCSVGEIHHNADGTLRCQCPRGEALVARQGSERCEPCLKLKLICNAAGTNASTALVQEGHARLRKGSYKVYKCLDTARCEPARCAEGYTGRLCSDCAPRHHASSGQCQPCNDLADFSAARMALLVFCIAAALAFIIAAAWFIRRKLADASLRLKCALALLVPQLFALLQLVQLWGVVARLAQPPSDFETADINDTANVTAMVEDSKGDTWASYLEMFQLQVDELQGLVALQCLFDAATVRLLFAVATPLLPLALLLGCCLVELFTVGAGIRFGLRLLTILFIGGASGASQLLECQRVGGTGKVSLEEFAFRRSMPHLLCTEEKWVDLVGKACAVCYGVVIPSFLALVFAKQHLVMRQTKTFFAQYRGTMQKATLQLQMVDKAESLEEDVKKKRLVAAAAVFVALHVRGSAVVTLAKDGEVVTVDQVQTAEWASVDLVTDFSVDLLVQPHEAAILRSRGEIMRHNAMVQMLTERSILAKIQLDRSDRIMLGAKQLLCKYGSCQFVWMEVCETVAAAALVSVVDSEDGLWLSMVISLGMALVVGITQPFGRPQENLLRTSCFVCLAIAAVGFRELYTWLTRLALLLPVLLLVVTLARPDSQEALAMRLYEELEAKLPHGPVEVSTERLQFL